MNVLEEYKRKLRTPEQAVQVIKSGDWIDYTTSLGQPILLDRALAARRDELTDVKIRGNLVFGPLEVAECDPSQEHFIYHSWHCSSYERSLCDRGLCYYIPMVFHLNSDYYKHFLTVNVAPSPYRTRTASSVRWMWRADVSTRNLFSISLPFLFPDRIVHLSVRTSLPYRKKTKSAYVGYYSILSSACKGGK